MDKLANNRQLYFLEYCAHSEVFVLLLSQLDLNIGLVSVSQTPQWRDLTPQKTVPFIVTEEQGHFDSQSVLEFLLEKDRFLSPDQKMIIKDVQQAWKNLIEQYINSELRGVSIQGFHQWAGDEFSLIIETFLGLEDRARLYVAAILMPYLKRTYYINEYKPDSLVLGDQSVWHSVEQYHQGWKGVVVPKEKFYRVIFG